MWYVVEVLVDGEWAAVDAANDYASARESEGQYKLQGWHTRLFAVLGETVIGPEP